MNAPMRLTGLAHGGGCGCKLAPAVLQQILAKMPAAQPYANMMVGIETGDDAAVYRLNADQAIIATTDFFTPIVDDPRDFGRIAATNAMSDVYAMGGTPIFALAIVGMPVDKLPLATVQEILAGGAAVCAEAGIPVAGGHSIDTPEPIYGLVVLGLVHPDRVLRNVGARPGDSLILTKGLGVGIYGAALKRGALTPDLYAAMIASTTQINVLGGDMPGICRRSCADRRHRLRAARPRPRNVPAGRPRLPHRFRGSADAARRRGSCARRHQDGGVRA